MTTIDPTPNQPHPDAILDTRNLEPTLAKLLQQFTVVFSIPHGLPPHRNSDHHIHLLPDATSVNVRPYRYPNCQKEIMTNMIHEMLQEGIIRPSTSSFSSPVILVKKKDGTWRFCVDYRTLDAITIMDRFPIPTVMTSLMNCMVPLFFLSWT